MKPFLVIAAWLALAGAAMGQTPSIEYKLTVKDPIAHLYDVEITIDGLRAASVDVSMPAWSPGVLGIRDFARNVQQFETSTHQNRPLAWEQIDKQTWRIAKAASDDVRVRYRVYSAAFSDEMADITPAAVFMYVAGQAHVPVSVEYEVDAGEDWEVHTGLQKRGSRYHADNYDSLVSAPAFVGKFREIEFRSAAKIPYRVVFSSPRIQMTALQVETDLEDLANAAAEMFGAVPFRDYLFLVRVQSVSGSSVVGYENSARISVGENDFVNQASYRAFLAAAAQGLVRAWNGSRLRPRSMVPYDYTREAYSRLFWFTEGVSAYSAEMLLLRANLQTPNEYYVRTSSEIDALQHQPGRLVTSLEEASWNAWTRSDNIANTGVSYIVKGKLAALLLDAEIRGQTQGERSLDNVLRYLFTEYHGKDRGLADDSLLPAIQAATGVNAAEFFERVVRGRGEIEYNRYLPKLGLDASSRKSPITISFGIEFERDELGQVRIRRVLAGTPAEAAKLDTGDVIIAMDSERVTYDNLVSRIHSKQLGKPVVLDVLRRQRLLSLSLIPQATTTDVWSMGETGSVSIEQANLRSSWLGSRR